MIVRTWHGCVPLKHAEGFAHHLQQTGVEEAQRTPGNLGAFVRQERQGEWQHFFLATYWEDLKAIIAFAGPEYQVAVTWPDDVQFELLSDPWVFQHEVQTITPI